eukprot:jgi/Chrzof1/14576/Cz09g08040.t1
MSMHANAADRLLSHGQATTSRPADSNQPFRADQPTDTVKQLSGSHAIPDSKQAKELWDLSSEEEDPELVRPDDQTDPLYDPDADDKDEQWVQATRQGRQSDAILSCPGCFTTICLDCQQHDYHHNQFRAMFVINCSTNSDEQITTSMPKSQARRKRGREVHNLSVVPSETMCKVVCDVCGTYLGAQDAQEVYHFYHVLSSEA